MERAVADGIHAVRNRNLRFAADVAFHGQSVRVSVIIESIAQPESIHAEAVVRLGKRNRRGAAKGAAKLRRLVHNMAVNRLYAVRNVDVRKPRAADKHIAFDLLQSLRKRQLRQSFAVPERAIANQRNALRNRNLLQRRAAGKYIAFKFRKPRGQNHLRHRFAILKRGTCLRHFLRHRDLRVRSQIFVQSQAVPVALVVKEITHLEIARAETVAAF